MIDIKMIRDQIEFVDRGVQAKNVTIDLKALQEMDNAYRVAVTELDDLRCQQNQASSEIGQAMKNKEDAQSKINAVKTISNEISKREPQVKALSQSIKEMLLQIPNLPHHSVPVGGVKNNKIIRSWGEAKKTDKTIKDHMALAESLDMIDFKRAAKISGSNFLLFKNLGARLERALFNFMLDVHTDQHGYCEVLPPYLVNRAAMTGTGQLPKMADDMYHVDAEDLFLIPTAEVPITNIHSQEILKEDDLPIRYAGYSACFRREAGSYGKDTRGLMRVHQFDKVELVHFVKPEVSYQALESLLSDAESILQKLNLPYRVLMLASGDLSFAAAKCYDIEVYAPGLDSWLEVSSCSNFEDFQARRAGIRYRDKNTKKTAFVHTLNGSGLALPRIVAAIMEQYQTPVGGIHIPEVLQPYMGGLTQINAQN